MNKLHTIKGGTQILIAEMDDQHLTNTVNLILHRIVELKAILTQEELSPFKKAVCKGNYRSFDKERVQESIGSLITSLHPYITEAMLRGLSFTEQLQTVFERTNQEVAFSSMGRLLSEVAEADMDDDDDQLYPGRL